MSAWRQAGDHLRLAVRLTPNGGRDAVDGIETDAGGDTYVKARVSAPPDKGKANRALTELVAKSVGVPKSSVTILSGETARKKILRIEGDPEDLSKRLETLLSGPSAAGR